MGSGANLVFHIYDTREEWLEARSKSACGASTLSHFMVDGKKPRKLPDTPAMRNALEFGSNWEPMVAALFMDRNGLENVGKNIPVAMLEPGQFTWHDNSFYTRNMPLWDGMHVSYDAVYVSKDGYLNTVEIKTGSAPSLTWVSGTLREAYKYQAGMEATFIGASRAQIVYCQRPENWTAMTSEHITEYLSQHMGVTEVPPMSEETLLKSLSAYKTLVGYSETTDNQEEVERMQTEEQERNDYKERQHRLTIEEGNLLLETVVQMTDKLSIAKTQLCDWLKEHPGIIPEAEGKKAKISISKRRNVDYKKFFTDHPADDLDKYTTFKETERLSITNAKE